MQIVYEIEDYEQFKADFLEASPIPSIAPGFPIKDPDIWIRECGLRYFNDMAVEGRRIRAADVVSTEPAVKMG